MKILILSQDSEFNYNKRLHGDFLRLLKKTHGAVIADHSMTYEEFKSLYETVKPDVFITYNSNGSSKGKRNYERFIKQECKIKYAKCKKFHITTDFLREGEDQKDISWFSEMGYDQAIFRHKSSLNYDVGIDTFWLPFSINRRLFLDNSDKAFSRRSKSLSFCGSYSSKSVYPLRNRAIEVFLRHKKLNISKKRLIDHDYVRFLSGSMISLTCGGKCRYFTAKYLEILASGSFMICGETDGLEMLPEGSYFSFDENNIAESLSKAYEIFACPNKFEPIVKDAKNYVLVKHNNEKRARQFLKNMEKYL
jgi:hypothetical protein